jgi:hypothetical protein
MECGWVELSEPLIYSVHDLAKSDRSQCFVQIPEVRRENRHWWGTLTRPEKVSIFTIFLAEFTGYRSGKSTAYSNEPARKHRRRQSLLGVSKTGASSKQMTQTKTKTVIQHYNRIKFLFNGVHLERRLAN